MAYKVNVKDLLKQIRDYVQSDNLKGVEPCFESPSPVTNYGTTIYSVVDKPSNGDKYLHVRPLNGVDFLKRIAKGNATELVHVFLRQHLDDVITNIPRRQF